MTFQIWTSDARRTAQLIKDAQATHELQLTRQLIRVRVRVRIRFRVKGFGSGVRLEDSVRVRVKVRVRVTIHGDPVQGG